MPRFIRLRVRPGTGLHTFGDDHAPRHWRAGDELVARYEDAAAFLRDKGRRSFQIVEDFEDESGETTLDIDLRD